MTKEREQVFSMFEGKCAYCGDPLAPGWHVDHREPIGRESKFVYVLNTNKPGWSTRTRVKSIRHPERDVLTNKFPSCASCNINKRGKSIEGFRKFIENMTTSLNRDSVIYKISKRYGRVVETDKPVVFYYETYYNELEKKA